MVETMLTVKTTTHAQSASQVSSDNVITHKTITIEPGGERITVENGKYEPNSSTTAEQTELKYRVGYWWSEKKGQKLNPNELVKLFAEQDCELVKLDFDRPLEEQGPFAVIVHKISDILVKADLGDANARRTINAFENYVRKHPQTVVLDPLENNRILSDRYKQYRLIEQTNLAKEGIIFTPSFVHLTSTNLDVNRGRIRRSKITFPLVCKPIMAQGSHGAHQMCIIFNEAGLKDVKPPCVAQSFVNHNAKLFKLFVIKDKYHVIERPSLKNFQAGELDTVFFYSHDISKPNSSSSLTELDEEDKLNLEQMMQKLNITSSEKKTSKQPFQMVGTSSIGETSKADCNTSPTSHDNTHETGEGADAAGSNPAINQPDLDQLEGFDKGVSSEQTKSLSLMPSKGVLDQIVATFNEKLGLTFYGLDIIIENGTSRYAIIDMNTFPGYDGVDGFLSMFRDVVCDAIPNDIDGQQNGQTQLTKIRKKPIEFDSGIEST